jgi:hypothetical protein
MKKAPNKPVVGSDIYVGTSLYIDHGEDDFQGGLCTIKHKEMSTSAGKPTWFVTVKERPGVSYNWEILMERQEELKAEFGNNRGYKDPDPGYGSHYER